ncbi:hypothetical protein DRB89_08935 [Streptomyces sp. ICC4]|nr:hypothetical protein DRB89_08935 [Streptomyces sp. ICC4]
MMDSHSAVPWRIVERGRVVSPRPCGFDAGGERGRAWMSGLGDLVLHGSPECRLSAWRRSTGEPRRQADRDGRTRPLAAAAGLLFLSVGDGDLCAVDAETGAALWSRDPDDGSARAADGSWASTTGPAVVAGDRVLVTAYRGTVIGAQARLSAVTAP